MMKLDECPCYLSDFKLLWHENHKAAILEWFRSAKYGMLITYGLNTLLHNREWVQYYDKIPLTDYERLMQHFTAHNFDADYITDLALSAGMKYINFTTCHHEGFCLWDSAIEPYNVMHTPCERDLVLELSEACNRKGLGFFAYYTFMLNWHYPYFVDTSVLDVARPHYETPEKAYLYRSKEDFPKYIAYIEGVMDELLSKYKVTGIWLDLIAAWYAMGEEYIPIEQIYANIRKRHPNVLISWKQGATGTEDFASPEHYFHDMSEEVRGRFGNAGAERARFGFESNRNKHNEVCATIQEHTWGYNPRFGYKTEGELYKLLGYALENNCNLLLNTGLTADGSVDPIQARLLQGVISRVQAEGWPTRGQAFHQATTAGAE